MAILIVPPIIPLLKSPVRRIGRPARRRLIEACEGGACGLQQGPARQHGGTHGPGGGGQLNTQVWGSGMDDFEVLLDFFSGQTKQYL